MEKRIKELLEKEFLTVEELEELTENDFVTSWQNNGNSGRYNGHVWYTITTLDGGEYELYSK